MSEQGLLERELGEEHVDDRSGLVRRAAALFKARQLRSSIFGQALFGEPAWDMLIALYLADSKGQPVTVSGLAEWARCPSTTGLRWLQVLEAKRLASRRAHPSDRRMHFVELTERGRQALDGFFARAPAF
jgi:DNA-binding MarR family transcriptional regulator